MSRASNCGPLQLRSGRPEDNDSAAADTEGRSSHAELARLRVTVDPLSSRAQTVPILTLP
jgi:hypothetical protein